MSLDDVSHPALGVAGMGAIDIPKQSLPAMYDLLRCCTIVNKPFRNGLSGPFHKKIYSLWNRPKSLFLRMVQDVIFT
ncbi:hypothetical protein QUA00_27020 [Microcoleus sp. T2B6]|uniref:hypothetical protein n=1 Tax=Microcoleus sp. T2B6 TaxID=3055424 RepID=UPI002FD49ABD